MSQQSKLKIFRLGFKTNEWNSKYVETNNEDRALYLYQETQIRKFLLSIFKKKEIFTYNFKIVRSHNKVNVIITYFTNIHIDNKNSQPFKNKLTDFLNFCNNEEIEHPSYSSNVKSFNDIKQKDFSTLQILKVLQSFVGKSSSVSIKLLNIKTSLFFKEQFKKKLLQIVYQLRKYQKKEFFFQTLVILLITYQKKNSAELLGNWITLQLSKLKIHNQFLAFLNVALVLLLNSYFSNIKGIKILIKGRLNNKPRKQTKIIQAGKISLQTFESVINQSQSTAYTKNGTLGIKVWICEN